MRVSGVRAGSCKKLSFLRRRIINGARSRTILFLRRCHACCPAYRNTRRREQGIFRGPNQLFSITDPVKASPYSVNLSGRQCTAAMIPNENSNRFAFALISSICFATVVSLKLSAFPFLDPSRFKLTESWDVFGWKKKLGNELFFGMNLKQHKLRMSAFPGGRRGKKRDVNSYKTRETFSVFEASPSAASPLVIKIRFVPLNAARHASTWRCFCCCCYRRETSDSLSDRADGQAGAAGGQRPQQVDCKADATVELRRDEQKTDKNFFRCPAPLFVEEVRTGSERLFPSTLFLMVFLCNLLKRPGKQVCEMPPE